MNEETGSLDISVFSKSLGLPLGGVTIEIRQQENVINTLMTNIIGQTETVYLKAPSVEYSLDENNNKKPYSEYTIIASKNGYDKVVVDGVQIFADTTAIQEIFLNAAEKLTIDVITVEEPTLYGDYAPKIPESEVKPLPQQTGFIVLPEPVIPEFIVVHDGIPTDTTAKDYKVSFIDYIKNVACCEIYSTWPKETIAANVLAIMSFTLNRVYTEWYRSKGYKFTITSSTAYDQAFSYGRNIFEEVAVIVEEQFTNYVTKPGIRQPLFTQYCDGKKSDCPNWMSQWGSKNLGEKNYQAVDILKYYYGQDVYIETAKKVEGIPESFQGEDLKVGSTGKQVRVIQEQLNAISKNFPLIPKVKVDGVYGEETRESVAVFQEVFKLPVTGIVDKKTWYKISQIYVAVNKLAG